MVSALEKIIPSPQPPLITHRPSGRGGAHGAVFQCVLGTGPKSPVSFMSRVNGKRNELAVVPGLTYKRGTVWELLNLFKLAKVTIQLQGSP